MKEGYRLLGDFIRQVDVRNTDGKEEKLLGVSVQKMFIPSIANTVGTDFTKYKVVKRGQFTYIPDTSRRGDKDVYKRQEQGHGLQGVHRSQTRHELEAEAQADHRPACHYSEGLR